MIKKTFQEIKLCEIKQQVDRARSRMRLNLGLAFSTEGEAGDEGRGRGGLLSAGQVGAKHQRLACASLLNFRLPH